MSRPDIDDRGALADRGVLWLLVATLGAALLVAGLLVAGSYLFGRMDPARPAAATAAGSPGQSPSPSTSDSVGLSVSPSPSISASPTLAATTAAARRTTAARSTPVQTGNAGPEAQVVTLVNTERANAGCAALAVDSRLTTAARGHSTDMATNNYFSHDSQDGRSVGDRVTAAGYSWSMVGENIAMGQATAQSVMQAWMNSAGHKANILNCGYQHIGVGLAYDSSHRPYWTQDFGTPRR